MAKRKPKAKAMGPKRPAKVGRPTKLTPEMIERAKDAMASGKTKQQVAEELWVCNATVYNWQGNSTEFLDAINNSAVEVDKLVENSLLKRALGYTKPVEHVVVDKFGKEHKIQSREVVDGSVSAMIFWLKNRQPKKWRDKRELELGENTKRAWGLAYSLEEPPEEREVDSEVLDKASE